MSAAMYKDIVGCKAQRLRYWVGQGRSIGYPQSASADASWGANKIS